MKTVTYSGRSKDILENIENDKLNKFSLQNISKKYIVDDKVIFQMFDLLNDYRVIIFANLIEISLENEEEFLPELTALKHYGSPDLWYLVLYCNDIMSKFNYKLGDKKILNPNNLDKLNKIIESNKKKLTYNSMNPHKIYLKDDVI